MNRLAIEAAIRKHHYVDSQLAKAGEFGRLIAEVRDLARKLLGPWQDWVPPASIEQVGIKLGISAILRSVVPEKGRLVMRGLDTYLEVERSLSEVEYYFVVAHELGHIALGRAGLIPHSQAGFSCTTDRHEEACDLFARELLVPLDWFISQNAIAPIDPNRIVSIQESCKIPFEAMLVRYVDSRIRSSTLVRWTESVGSVPKADWSYSPGKRTRDPVAIQRHGKAFQQSENASTGVWVLRQGSGMWSLSHS